VIYKQTYRVDVAGNLQNVVAKRSKKGQGTGAEGEDNSEANRATYNRFEYSDLGRLNCINERGKMPFVLH